MRGVSSLEEKVPAGDRSIFYPSPLPLKLSASGGFCNLESPVLVVEIDFALRAVPGGVSPQLWLGSAAAD